ncbi:hypothetical protein [Mycolicibacterium sphagni]|uniref:hypothetical protein n=1 Tax=Mycolicibacterium sphagni TaxID=1786 RepID=UPI0021F300FD|nr:hypothetical protein [Mycolicibacterium sphagni]MCV7176757.1 hypothetical protein [Mycolicibacterium sphagni]
MHIQMKSHIQGGFHTHYCDLHPGDILEIEDTHAARYNALGIISDPAPNIAELQQYWTDRAAADGLLCHSCHTAIEPTDTWVIPHEHTDHSDLWRAPVHTRCTIDGHIRSRIGD